MVAGSLTSTDGSHGGERREWCRDGWHVFRPAAIMLDITIGAKAAAEFGEDLADIVRETPIDDCCVLGRLHVGVRSIQKGTGKSILDCIPSFTVSRL